MGNVSLINGHIDEPKKPVKHGFDPNKLISSVHYTCPVCNSHISRDANCSNCGQEIDWSDGNDR